MSLFPSKRGRRRGGGGRLADVARRLGGKDMALLVNPRNNLFTLEKIFAKKDVGLESRSWLEEVYFGR